MIVGGSGRPRVLSAACRPLDRAVQVHDAEIVFSHFSSPFTRGVRVDKTIGEKNNTAVRKRVRTRAFVRKAGVALARLSGCSQIPDSGSARTEPLCRTP